MQLLCRRKLYFDAVTSLKENAFLYLSYGQFPIAGFNITPIFCR